MPKFRKKRVEIEAFQWTGSWEPKPDWFEAAIRRGDAYRPGDYWVIKTLEGDHKASLGDWIIQGVKGEIYPCKPEIFEMTYEAVENDA